MTTETQECQQTEGPHRPVPEVMIAMLRKIPSHVELRAVSINGQTGIVTIETLHEGLEQAAELNIHGQTGVEKP